MIPKPRPAAPIRTFFAGWRWIDGSPLDIEPYRLHLFEQFFDERDAAGHPRYNLGLFGRAKKNYKTADAMLAAFRALLVPSPGGNQVYVVANDEDQAGDDLALAKKIVKANPQLARWVVIRKNRIELRDGTGFIEVLPADAIGTQGKTYRLLIVDEIHAYRTWDLLEALALDPSRPDAQQWITSYASLIHRPGAPLFDMLKQAKANADLRMLFSWYAADTCTDPAFANKGPEERANPSMATWNNPGYLDQQRRRLPAQKFRRLHLNLPGLPEGSAFQPEPIMDAVARGISVRPHVEGVNYFAFVDMSGGSSDDAVLAIAHRSLDGDAVLDCIVNQGQPAPFNPSKAVDRFVRVLGDYHLHAVEGDHYAGETFAAQFEAQGIRYAVAEQTKSELYEQFEVLLNGKRVQLLDVPKLEEQLLSLVWRGNKIDHPGGEQDDYANACVGALLGVGLSSMATLPAEFTSCNRVLNGMPSNGQVCYLYGGMGRPVADVLCRECVGNKHVKAALAAHQRRTGQGVDLIAFYRSHFDLPERAQWRELIRVHSRGHWRLVMSGGRSK